MAIRFDHKPGLVVYITAGDPTLEATREIALAAIDAGADVIELGVPFSDPLADGPIIQRASERALAHHTRLKDVLALAREIRTARPAAGLVIFSYLNPILRYGLSRFADDAAAAGVDGVLATDMIVEEAGEYLAELNRVGLAPIFLAAPTSPDERLEAIAKASLRWSPASAVFRDRPDAASRWPWGSASPTRNTWPRWPGSRMPRSSAARSSS
jgi:tryptophan synthase alpha chain